jgi:hypothetical protein
MPVCPPGYYWTGKTCKKSIELKRENVYGKGFLSEPQTQQYKKIKKEAKIEGPVEVEHQMSALNAFSHNKGSAHKDLEFAEKIAHEEGHGRQDLCSPGHHKVKGFWSKHGYVRPHCAKDPRGR